MYSQFKKIDAKVQWEEEYYNRTSKQWEFATVTGTVQRYTFSASNTFWSIEVKPDNLPFDNRGQDIIFLDKDNPDCKNYLGEHINKLSLIPA